MTWREDLPKEPAIGAGGWARIARRGVPLGVVTFGGLALMLVLRLIERPLCGTNRPMTPYITQGVCRAAFRIMGLGFATSGVPLRQGGAIVANHGSWLDIFALNARTRIYFVAKSEVAAWPGIGWLARATGTVFVARDRRDAANQREVFFRRLTAGHRLVFFPEGTSTDGQRVLPFKPTLFAAFFDAALREKLRVQPVTLIYHAPAGTDPRFYGWWGEMDFAPHLLGVLANRRQGRVEVIYHAPLAVRDFKDRKSLAQAAERAVRAPFEQADTVSGSHRPDA